jgi:antirestriction protein ArdC
MSRNSVFQTITDSIVAQLETGVRPWSKPWVEGVGLDGYPRNIKGRAYRGANVFWLQMVAQSRGYDSPYWLTFNQAKEAGGSVRKGEKGTVVFFWKFDKKQDAVTGEIKQSVMVKTYIVFNLAQVEGVAAPHVVPRTEAERIEDAEALAVATGARIGWGGNRAFYSPAFDSVQMPLREAFKSPDVLYGTLFHEIGHWTGHTSRLARDFTGRFGTEAYAFEELVAELTAAFVCGAQGFGSPERRDHAAYIQSWLKVLKADPRAFITAASKAQAAADFILAFADAEGECEPETVPAEALALAA